MQAAKRILSLTLALVLVLALAACGNKTNDDNNTNSDNNNATDFPTKPMTIVCPYGAGGGTDLALRILAECGKDVFGQTINVENKTGGSGTVGLTEALNAAADGYTLGTCSVDLITLPLLGLAPAETTRDAFDPICVINGEPAAIIVRADSRWNTIEEFIAEAKEKPGTVQLANMAFRTRYGAEEELRKSGYHDVGQNRWESDKMIAAITEVKVL